MMDAGKKGLLRTSNIIVNILFIYIEEKLKP